MASTSVRTFLSKPGGRVRLEPGWPVNCDWIIFDVEATPLLQASFVTSTCASSVAVLEAVAAAGFCSAGLVSAARAGRASRAARRAAERDRVRVLGMREASTQGPVRG